MDVIGPIDFLLMEFPRDGLAGGPANALADLIDRGLIRLYDLVVIDKKADGSYDALDLSVPGPLSEFASFVGARSGLLSDEDLAEAAAAMEPGMVAALVVYENSWAVPFVAAARDAGGEVIASARIPAADIMETLELLEAASS